ncbi:hypothetical protein Hanom_Chr04g00358591 [Helianthus anomalus]
MSVELPPLKWPRETFDVLVQNLRFPENRGARYLEEGQTAADAPAGYVTLFWDFFCLGNFRLSVTKFFLEILEYYKFHISQMHPIGMVRFDILSLFAGRCILNQQFLDLSISSNALYSRVLLFCSKSIGEENFAESPKIIS